MAKVSLRAYNREIEAMIDRSHLDEAVAHCQHILKIFPKHLETYRLLGKAYLEAKRHNEAVDIFSRVLAAEPNDFVAHVGMSIIRDEQNKLDDAIWHMERAFEVQSANPAIQGELQRLYGRREGSQPPRIRMTRGALAHMYMRGELYPQAISETKSVLEEDQGRSDMQVLLAKAYYQSGQKNDAADAASAVLKRYPFCLDANLVLAEILSNDRPESAQAYRQRVIELDPYAAQVADNMFLAGKVSDAAVSIEHLEWNGQPVGMSTDWGSKQAIGLESGLQDEQPEWMKEPPPSVPAFDSEQGVSSTPLRPEDDIPEFLRAAGWGEATGAFDESKSSAMFDDEPAPSAEPLAAGDLPDWVRAMAPPEASQPSEKTEEEIPDWINKIGTSDLPVSSTDQPSDDQPDWLSGLGETSASVAADGSDWTKEIGQEEAPASETPDDQMDWLRGLDQEETPAVEPSGEQPDWLKGFDADEQPTPESDEQSDWLKGLGQEETPVTELSAEGQDWMDDLGGEEQPALELSGEQIPPVSDEQPDWLKSFEADAEVTSQPSDKLDFLDELKSETEESVQTPAPPIDTGSLGSSEQEQDDSFAWLENLAAKQGATEGLLTTPEERLEDEPDWIKQAKGLSQPEIQQPVEEPVQEEPISAVGDQPSADVEDLGKSGQEIDDALAWFEGLAAKQGATEGLLTKPEERVDQEPEWVKRVKSAGNARKPAPVQEPPVEQPSQEVVEPAAEAQEEIVPEPVSETPAAGVSLEDLGKSDAERDDSFAWLEALAAKQGASEGLLTKPEDRLEQEPEWVKQVKKSTGELRAETEKESFPVEAPPPSAPVEASTDFVDELEEEPAIPSMELPTEPEPVVIEPTPAEDVSSWLKGLDEEEAEETSQPLMEDDTTAWLKSLDEAEEEPITPEVSASDDLPAWMQEVSEDEVSEPETVIPAEEAEISVESQSQAPETESEAEEMPEWLSSLEEEEQKALNMPASLDLPAWMRDETGELVAEPTKIEPTRTTDWAPVDEMKEEEAPPPAPEPASEPKPEPTFVSAQDKPAPKAKKSAPKKEEVKPSAQPEPYKEPVTRRGIGISEISVDPILASARTQLSRSNIPGALDVYGKLIKKGRFLEEAIFDLREALYRYPVEVSIWQALGDAYMRANQLQDALDAYTKAEELLR